MTLLANNGRFLGSWRRFASPRVIPVAAIAITSGCAIAPTTGTFIPMRPSEGARWIAAEAMDSYGCDASALVCSADGGRLSERRCRCGGAR
jgi:hypothetical protein